MVEGVLVVDETGKLQVVNEAARRMLRVESNAAGRPYVEAIRHPGIAEQFAKVLAGGPAQAFELAVSRDGPRDLVARLAPVVATGRGAILVLHDITDFKRADRIRRDFVANVSHELRTPLTAIKGYAEALLDEPDDADARQRFLEIIQRHSARMERLVKDLLRLARLDARQEQLERVPTDVPALLRRGRRRHGASSSPRSDLAVAVEADRARDAAAVRSTRAKVHDIVRNLVENAVNYTQAGGTVGVRAAVRRRRADDRGDRQRAGHPVRGPRPGLRAVLPRRQVARPARRHRARPGHREAPRRPARRQRHGRESAGRRRPLHRATAGRLTRRSEL